LIGATFIGFSVVGFLMGFFIGGASAGMMALAALSYPTALRSTGVGWGIAVARLGSAIGPIVAGGMISAGGGRLDVFAALAACAGVAGFTIIVLRSVTVRQRRLASA
jgi:AAHS family 4-hydroxybenzoate transporter-like MFS transporter